MTKTKTRPHHDDPAELARLRARVDYWTKKEAVERPEDAIRLLTTEFLGEVEITNSCDARCGEKVTTPLFRVSSVAALLGKSVQTVRLWERDGVIPVSQIILVGRKRGQTTQRGYTYAQMRAIYDLLPLLEFGDVRGAQYAAFSRELWKRWAAMPDGVIAEPRTDDAPPPTKGRRRRVAAG